MVMLYKFFYYLIQIYLIVSLTTLKEKRARVIYNQPFILCVGNLVLMTNNYYFILC